MESYGHLLRKTREEKNLDLINEKYRILRRLLKLRR